jgi:hypothetical protein
MGSSRGGISLRGWKPDAAFAPRAENRSHGASLGAKLRGLCDGTRLGYVSKTG